MQWASTIKEVELSHFFKEWPAMWKRFWDIWIVSWVIIVGCAVMASPVVPYAYRMWVALSSDSNFHRFYLESR